MSTSVVRYWTMSYWWTQLGGEQDIAACPWAKLGRIVYACRIEDAEKFGIWQIPISSAKMKRLGHSGVELLGDLLREESLKLFEAWRRGTPTI